MTFLEEHFEALAGHASETPPGQKNIAWWIEVETLEQPQDPLKAALEDGC